MALSTPVRPPPPREPRSWLLPISLVVIGLCAVALVPALSSAHAEPAAPVEPASTELAITSTPDGASVEVDGERRGSTPLTISVDEGETLTVKVSHEGHRPLERELDATSEDVAFALEALPLRLVLEGVPDEAEVTIDGEVTADRTLTLDALPEAPLAIAVRQRGFETFEASVAPDAFDDRGDARVATVSVRLAPIARPVRRARPRAPESAPTPHSEPTPEPAAPSSPVPSNPF